MTSVVHEAMATRLIRAVGVVGVVSVGDHLP